MADTKLSNLASSTAVVDADSLYVVDGGVSKKVVVSTLKKTFNGHAATLVALKAATWGVDGATITLSGRLAFGDGGGGDFVFNSADLSTEVTADTQNSVYVPPDSDNTGASGAWVRLDIGDLNVEWFGAVGDGATDNLAEIVAVEAGGEPGYFVPNGDFLTSAAATTLAKRYFGEGQIETSEGKRGRYFSAVSTAPADPTTENISDAFDGDMTNVPFPVEHRVTGTALGTPTGAYKNTVGAYPFYVNTLCSSGFNESTDQNGPGRTGYMNFRSKILNSGEGDAICFNGSVTISGQKAASTSFLANGAGSILNGDVFGGADGVYLNAIEIHHKDMGFDVGCVGYVASFTRTDATGAKSAAWNGYRIQSNGAEYMDAGVILTGKMLNGLDLAASTADFGTNLSAISMKADDRLYFNSTAGAMGNLDANWRTTVWNKDYIAYNSATSKIDIVVNNIGALSVSGVPSTPSVLTTKLNVTEDVNLSTGKKYQVNSNNVVGDRVTGWTAATGTATRTAFATSTVTTEVLAQHVKALIDDLTTHGLIGA